MQDKETAISKKQQTISVPTEKGNTMTFEKAITKLLTEYLWAKDQKHIRNPIAYSLYQVWKQADGEGKDNERKVC